MFETESSELLTLQVLELKDGQINPHYKSLSRCFFFFFFFLVSWLPHFLLVRAHGASDVNPLRLKHLKNAKSAASADTLTDAIYFVDGLWITVTWSFLVPFEYVTVHEMPKD